MKGMVKFLALALALVAALSGCSKCGGWEELKLPQAPRSCADDGAR